MRAARRIRFIGFVILASASSCALPPAAGADDAAPPIPAEVYDAPGSRRWIWIDAEQTAGSEGWFRRAFEYAGPVESAALFATCDNEMRLFLNGTELAHSREWTQPLRLDVTDELRQGNNVLGVWGRNEAGPAGLLLELTITAGGRTSSVASNARWRVASEPPRGNWTSPASDAAWNADDERWSGVTDLGAYGIMPWRHFDKNVPPASNAALAAGEISVPAGFRAERLLSVPLERHGSWVSLSADDRGRLYASDQYGGLFRITPPPLPAPGASAPSEPAQVEELQLELGQAQGLLWAFDSLYVVVNSSGAYPSGLYRVRDIDADDTLDSVELLKRLDGHGEHGPHAVVLAPEGDALFVVAGNHTQLPSELTSSRVPELWGEDQLLPRRSDPNGHAVGKLAPGGWICRTDPDGAQWELVACGLRNAYDIDFSPAGELFTFDSDMEWDIGLPWYRPTRVLHVTSGAEFGWRHGSGKWPDFYPDSLGSVVDVGISSPTGVTFGTHARFPSPWQNAFFVADWSYGKIFAVHLDPRGASYTATVEPFVSGRPLPVTDVVVASDGALYFTTGGRRTQSGLYRVSWTGDAASGEPSGPPDTESNQAARAQRRALEALHAPGVRDAQAAIHAALAALGDADRSLRFAARTALEHQDPALWSARALALDDLDASIEALVALSRAGANLSQEVLLASALRWPFETMDAATLRRALRALALILIRVPEPEDGSSLWAPLSARLLARLPTGSDLTDRELCRVLTRLQAEGLAPKAIRLLDEANTQAAAIDLAHMLSHLQVGWTDELRARLLRWFDVDAAELQGGNSFREYVDFMRADALESLGVSLPAAAGPAPDGGVEPAEPAAAFVRNWTLEELSPELERVATGRSFERGRALYRRTSCLDCHRIDGGGGSTGPDLTGAGGRFSARDLLEALLDPSSAVSDQYVDTEIWTRDGQVNVGRVAESEADHLVLRRAADDERVRIERADVEFERPHPLSRMPAGLLDTCSVDDVLDLLAYVLAGGKAADPAFTE